ncbi:MAG: hypothetical protein MI923_05710 [Phycisphaerales bacterium]|nr:hypothetical protein [Phycisphaerales bacterium]
MLRDRHEMLQFVLRKCPPLTPLVRFGIQQFQAIKRRLRRTSLRDHPTAKLFHAT